MIFRHCLDRFRTSRCWNVQEGQTRYHSSLLSSFLYQTLTSDDHQRTDNDSIRVIFITFNTSPSKMFLSQKWSPPSPLCDSFGWAPAEAYIFKDARWRRQRQNRVKSFRRDAAFSAAVVSLRVRQWCLLTATWLRFILTLKAQRETPERRRKSSPRQPQNVILEERC